MADIEVGEPALPARVLFARQVRRVRQLRGYTQAELAARLTRVGLRTQQPAVARIEKGSRGLAVTLDEVFAFALALGVSPLSLITPPDDDPAGVMVATDVVTTAEHMRDWLIGNEPPPGVPIAEWLELLSPAARRRYGNPAIRQVRAKVQALADAVAGDDADLSTEEGVRTHAERVLALVRDIGLIVQAYLVTVGLLSDVRRYESGDGETSEVRVFAGAYRSLMTGVSKGLYHAEMPAQFLAAVAAENPAILPSLLALVDRDASDTETRAPSAASAPKKKGGTK